LLRGCCPLLRLIGNVLDLALACSGLLQRSVTSLHAQANASAGQAKARKISAANVAKAKPAGQSLQQTRIGIAKEIRLVNRS
jgi:hypothetical protein